MPYSRFRSCLFPVFVPVLISFCCVAHAQNAPLAARAASLISGSPKQLLASCRADLDRARSGRLKLLEMKPPRDSIAALDTYDTMSLLVNDVVARAALAQVVLPSKQGREAAQTCEQEAAKLRTDLSLDRKVYDVLASLDQRKLDPVAQYVLRADLLDYRRTGIDKDDATRAKIGKLNEELVKISQEFHSNIAGDVRRIEFDPADLDGLPDDYRRSHSPGANGKITLTTDNTDFLPFMRYANSSKAREAFFRLYMQKAYPKNMDVLEHMLSTRYEFARLLGYGNWAEYVLETMMAGSKQNVAQFIDQIAKASTARLQADYSIMLSEKKRLEPSATAIDVWDVFGRGGYLLNKVRAEKYDFDSKQARPYFEYSRVKQGLLDLTGNMYGISYRLVPDAARWHQEVEVYDVYEGDRRLARIYFDLFPRENKYKHYMTSVLAVGKKGVETPEGVLVCNFPRPGKEPALMEYSDVITLFHEYGHLLDVIFSGQNRWDGPDRVMGLRDSDFVETASQLMEEWARDPEVLRSFAKHYQTNEPMPAEMVKKMLRADEVGRGLSARWDLTLAAASLRYYEGDPKGLNTDAIMAESYKYLPFKYVDGTHFQTQITHLDSYSAAYYTYLWSQVMAKDAFSVFREKGMLDRETATRFRRAVLDCRGTRPAADQIQEFLGRPYSVKAFEDWVNSN